MAHYAFLMLPEAGHLLPTMRIGRALQTLGHKVSYISLSSASDYLHGKGFEVLTLLESVLPKVRSRVYSGLPDPEAIQQCFAAQLTSRGISLGELIAEDLSTLKFDILLCDGQFMKQFGSYLEAQVKRPILSIATSLPDADASGDFTSPELILCPKDFEFAEGVVSAAECSHPVLWVEPSIFREGQIASLEKKGRPRPKAYLSFGTQSWRYSNIDGVILCAIDATACLGFDLILACPRSKLPNQGVLATHVSHQEHAPQLALLATVDVFVSHGGLGSIKEAISAQVPSVVIPFDSDQPANAARVVHRRLGSTCLPTQVSPEIMAELLDGTVNDVAIRGHLKNMSEVFWTAELAMPSLHAILDL